MRKLVALLCMFFAISVSAQIKVYDRNLTYAYLFDGTKAGYDSAYLKIGFDTTYFRFLPPDMIWLGPFNQLPGPFWVIQKEFDQTTFLDTLSFRIKFTQDPLNIYPPYVNNQNGYIPWADTVNGGGNKRIMTTKCANDSINVLKTAISNKANKTASFSFNGTSFNLGTGGSWTYSPSSTAINTALGYTPYNGSTNPNNFLTNVTSGQISTALGFTPYSAANPSNYISGITGTMVNNALGYTAYNGSTNPLNFLTTINSGQVTAALGYTPYNATNPNGYISGITGSLVNSALGYTAYNGSANPLNFLTSINSANVTTALGYTPYNGTTNPLGFLNSSYAPTWASITGKPSSLKRQETYSGTTNGSGVYTVTFTTAYSVAPNIQANPIGGSTEIFLKIVSVTTTGFTVNVFQRANVLSLALSTATTPVSGAAVDVLITEK